MQEGAEVGNNDNGNGDAESESDDEGRERISRLTAPPTTTNQLRTLR